MASSLQEKDFMREALRLAKRGEGWVSPNPMVGAVIMKNGRIIACGYHRGPGLPHAEIVALRAAGASTRGATLYVNLEPCRHHGRTPPCTGAIIRAGIIRVVCSTRDPNKTARGGINELRRAGIKVSVGILGREARELNEAFFTFHEMRRPFVALKFASTLDGKLGTRTGDSKWITSEQARAYARRLRGVYQALVVGIDTILADDPHLGARSKGLPDPLRVVLDSHLRIPLRAQVLRDKNVIVATTRRASAQKKRALEKHGIRILAFPGMHVPPARLFAALRAMNVISILVEGGGAVLGSFIDAGVVDKVYAFYSPILVAGAHAVSIGGRGVRTISNALRLTKVSVQRFGDTVLIAGSIRSRR